MADIPSHLEIGVTTGPIRGSRKVHVGPLKVAMREIGLEPSSGEPPVRVYDTSGPYTDPAATSRNTRRARCGRRTTASTLVPLARTAAAACRRSRPRCAARCERKPAAT